MKTIKLADKYWESLQNETKTQTIRKGKRDYNLGFIEIENVDKPYIQPVIITEICYKKLKDVTYQEAVDDGFDSIEDLENALLEFYPDITGETIVTIVKFTKKLS